MAEMDQVEITGTTETIPMEEIREERKITIKERLLIMEDRRIRIIMMNN